MTLPATLQLYTKLLCVCIRPLVKGTGSPLALPDVLHMLAIVLCCTADKPKEGLDCDTSREICVCRLVKIFGELGVPGQAEKVEFKYKEAVLHGQRSVSVPSKSRVHDVLGCTLQDGCIP